MKIAIVTPFYDPEKGACIVRVNAFKNYFKNRSSKVEILVPARNKINGKNRYSSTRALFLKILFGKFDVVIGTSPPLPHNFVAMLAAKLSGAKFILDAKDDGYYFENIKKKKKRFKFRVYSLLRDITYKFSDLTIYLTKEDLALEKKRYSLKNQFLVPNGSVKEVVFDSVSRKKIRAAARFTSKDNVGCYLGSIGDEDLGGLLKNSNGKKFIFIVSVSKDAQGEREINNLNKLINKYSKGSKIFENLNLGEVGKHLSAADYGVLPWNDFMPTSIPVKLFDYICVGLPVVTKGYENTAVSRFHKENNVGYFTTSWPAFFEKVNIVKSKKINKNIKNKFLRENIVAKLWVELDSLGWIK